MVFPAIICSNGLLLWAYHLWPVLLSLHRLISFLAYLWPACFGGSVGLVESHTLLSALWSGLPDWVFFACFFPRTHNHCPRWLRTCSASLARCLVRWWRAVQVAFPHGARLVPGALPPLPRDQEGLYAAWDVCLVVKHAGDGGGGSGVVADPVGAGFDSGLAGLCEHRVGPWRGQSVTGVAFYAGLRIAKRCTQAARCFRALLLFVILTKGADLASCRRRVADQGWCGGASWLAGLSASVTSRASSSAMVASNSACTTDAGTIRPAARSASLSSMARSHSGGGGREVSSSMSVR